MGSLAQEMYGGEEEAVNKGLLAEMTPAAMGGRVAAEQAGALKNSELSALSNEIETPTAPNKEDEETSKVIDGTVGLEEQEEITPEVAEQIREIEQLAQVPVEDQGSRKKARRIMRELIDPQNSSPSEAQANLELIHREVGQPHFARLFYNEVSRGRYKMYNHDMPILRTAEGLGMIFSSKLTSFTIQDGQNAIVAVRQGNVYINQVTGAPIILEDTFNVMDFSMEGMSNAAGLTLAERVTKAQEISDQRVESDYFDQAANNKSEPETTSEKNEPMNLDADEVLQRELAEAEHQKVNEDALSDSFRAEADAGRPASRERIRTYNQSLESVNIQGVTLTSVDLNDSEGGSMTAMLGGQGGVEVKIYPEKGLMMPASFGSYRPEVAMPIDQSNLTIMQILDTAADQSVVARPEKYLRDIRRSGQIERLSGLFNQFYPFHGVPLDETTVQSWARLLEQNGVEGAMGRIEDQARENGGLPPGQNLVDAGGRILYQNASFFRPHVEAVLRQVQVA